MLPLPQSLFALLVIVDATSASVADIHGEGIVEWLRSKGGFVDSRIELRRPDGNGSNFGIFTSGDIKDDELLFSIPYDCLITSKPQEPFHIGDRIRGNWKGQGVWYQGTVTAVSTNSTYDVHYDDGEDENEMKLEQLRELYAGEFGAMDCSTVRNLIKEMRLGNESEYSGYVNYLLEQKPGQLPSAWSTAGKELLNEVLGANSKGNVLPPYHPDDWLEEVYYPVCHGKTDPLEENAALMIVQRGWDDILVPFFDMVNHRNGRWINVKNNSPKDLENGSNVEVRASRDIPAGEELHYSYNSGPDCVGREETYGTPEMLRDYGFVEDYPQRWIFHNEELAFEIDEIYGDDGTGSGELQVTWIREEPNEEDTEEFLGFLREQLQRLKNFAEIESESPTEGIPKNERDVIWQYHHALVVAMTHAIQALRGDETLVYDGYDPLEEEEDRFTSTTPTCQDHGRPSFPTYTVEDEPYSPYHSLLFFHDSKNRDTCFELDGIVQICGSYRPHYHEMVVHNTARYVDTVKRVVFVGGGDSMLLHEILKYPSLELVVGLELDQKVTRNSFKHFGTQPHWDNDKVQWWFGDATKSLVMLPEDYFGSFDMVLVDLSETVMSFKVTGEMDMMEALSLLLKPEGVFVKNEMYLEKLSEVFDYTMQAHFYDCPVICDQSIILASNKVDFLYRDLVDHKTDNLFLKPIDETTDQYEYTHDIRKQNVRKHCREGDELVKHPEEQESSPGILMIVEAEDATGTLQPAKKLKDNIVEALKRAKIKVISSQVTQIDEEKAIVGVIMREGYVVARSWLESKYCAFDIHLWGGFEKHEDVKKELIEAVGGNHISSSSYRIVAGGMFGVGNWKEDEKKRGPRVTQQCESLDKSERNVPLDQKSIDIVMSESIGFAQDDDIVAAVVCGEKTKPCKSIEALENHDKVRKVVPVWTCPDLGDGSSRLVDCEKTVVKQLKESLATDEDKIRALVLDNSAPYPMARIVRSIFTSKRNQNRFLTQDVVVLATMMVEAESWRRNFLEKFRRDILMWEPTFRTEVLWSSSDSSMELGVVSSGDEHFIEHVKDIVSRIEKKTVLASEVRNIQGGLWRFQHDFEPSQFFLPTDYDQSAPLEQWSSQQPLGFQTLFQLEHNATSAKLSTNSIKHGLSNALAKMDRNHDEPPIKVEQFKNLGDGCLLVALWSQGSAVVLWNGRSHIDINLFTYTESANFASAFEETFKANLNLNMLLRDEQPRGCGRVVNYLSDVEPRVFPHWALHLEEKTTE